MGALSYAEIKAISSGNPLVLEKATVDAQAMKFSVLRDSWEQDRWSFNRRARSNVDLIRAMEETIAGVEQDAAVVSQEMAAGLKFKPTRKLGMALEGPNSLEAQIGASIHEASRSNSMIDRWGVGVVGGMEVILERIDGLQLSLRSQHDDRIRYAIRRAGTPIHDTFGTGKLVTDLIATLVEEPAIRRARIERLGQECLQIEASLKQPFEHEEAFKAVVLRQRAIEAELDLDKDEAGTVEAPEGQTA